MQKFFALLAGVVVLCTGRAGAQESLVPAVSGWNVTVDTRVYDANDLWDMIDGAADLYLEYAFVDLHVARYTAGEHRAVKAEFYRHRDAENAFGIYSAERNPEYHFIPIGTQGYQQTSVLNFVAGEFYLRLSSPQSDPASANDLLAIARAIETHLQRGTSLPKALLLFPAHGKQLNTEQFVAQNFLGYGFLRSVYTAVYGDSASFKVFIIDRTSKENADTTMREYFSKVPSATIRNVGADRYEVDDPNNGPVSIAREGNYLYGVLNCRDEKLKNEILAALQHTLSHR